MKKFRSKLEERVNDNLHSRGLMPLYETDKVRYSIHKYRTYIPDFKIRDVYIEVKGYWRAEDRASFLSMLASNPGIKIFVAFQNPAVKIAKGAKSSLGEWATAHAIPWCSIPIPPEFLDAWLQGNRVTHEMPKMQT